MRSMSVIAILANLLPTGALAQSESGMTLREFQLAQCGWYTQCWGYSDPAHVYIFESASNAQHCHQRIAQCAGQPLQTTFSSNAVLQPCNVTITRC